MNQSSSSSKNVVDSDILRWEGYKKIYDVMAGHTKERWQCGYNVLQMFIRQYCNVEIPLFTLQLYLRKKAAAFKQQEGEIANLTPEDQLKFGEFTQLEDMAAYMFDIKPFSDAFNDVMYYPALMSVTVGGNESMTVDQLFANEDGKYNEMSQEAKDARQTHLACVMEESKFKPYMIDEKEYTGGQLFARDYEGKGYILKGLEFDKVRSSIAVEDCSNQSVKIGGQMTTVSQLFSYEYDKKVYEDDRRNFAEVFFKKLRNYFESTQSRAGIPVVFNAMIYLIVDATMDPEPSVFMLDPHDMTYLGDKFKEKKKKVPMQYILGSPTGATLFFPPSGDETKNRIQSELEAPELIQESKTRFVHLVELALFNKETYLRAITKKHVGDPATELAEFFRLMEDFENNVFENATLEELCRIFSTSRDSTESILEFTLQLPFSFDLLTEELSHQISEFTPDQHKEYLLELFKFKNVFVSVPSFLRSITGKGLALKNEMLWHTCIEAAGFINIDRINNGIGPTARQPFKQEELQYYTYIFRGLLFLFNSQDRYSHVELVEEFLGSHETINRYYMLAALGDSLTKGSEFRNILWYNIVEAALMELAERLHKALQGTLYVVDMSIDRFLKLMEKGETKIEERLIESIAKAYEETCNYLYTPIEGVIFMVDKLKNRMGKLNIIKRQLLVAISANISAHADLKAQMLQKIKIEQDRRDWNDFNSLRDILLQYAEKLIPVVVKNPANAKAEIFGLPEGRILKEPARARDSVELSKQIDAMRLELGKDLNLLQQIIGSNIGKVSDIDKVQALIDFNELFKLEGSKDSEFASKINTVYNETYERIDSDDESGSENISPLSIRKPIT